ncbi:hypothetical protein SAMN04487820_10631 [Actinopolyspora mzabensis]|uniref:Uncharacterized protein n=1 Tax=Actinopolyspora mzabensis TaxID=995066 RepID=A0A1G9AGL0_ACTMZ|nr:hypothetical protein [Actinopolyspora mzabensis]SDK26411.1 hypothetical protein SAMN04487820_10631 [Actinopolyspora mzabensis]
MSENGIRADRDRLRGMASALRSSTDKLDAAANDAADMPQVSTSAEKVSHTLGELSKTAAAVIAAIDEIARDIDASDGSYGELDNRNAERLRKEYYDEYGGRAD